MDDEGFQAVLVCGNCQGMGRLVPDCRYCGGHGTPNGRRPIYIQISHLEHGRSVEMDGVVIDYSPEGRVIGIEILK